MSSWRAFTHYPGSISKLLAAIQLDDKLADLIITEKGVNIQTTASSRSFNAHLFLPKSLFTTFDYTASSSTVLSTTLSLPAAVNSLKMVVGWHSHEEEGSTSKPGRKSSVGCLFVLEPGNPLHLSFRQGSMQTTCDLTTYLREEDYDDRRIIVLDPAGIQLHVTMSSEVLTGLLADLETLHTRTVTIAAHENPSRLTIHGSGTDVEIDVELPVNEAHGIETMIAEPGVSFAYPMAHIGKCREVVKIATNISIRCDANGTLSVQCQCKFDSGSCYVEFRFLANA